MYLPVMAKKVTIVSRVLWFGSREGEVNGETLISPGCHFGGMRARSLLSLFRLYASGAAFQDRVAVLEVGDPVNVFVGIVEVMVTGMAKTLVLQHAFRSSFNGVDGSISMDVVMER
ncbi:hypothetical protein IV203_032113 [Nitzschia inconspicua]|uniref:Uncharacterized protein n=1 Tax=Nitzschia inconspicua TaxID=303405 RepID=A0A9K3Q3Q7_9STRA|nr:hypothetical protein IV203_032113 [Nitzschia inconspicua]